MSSGNFDYPPASSAAGNSTDNAPAVPPQFPSISPAEIPNLSARLHHLRQLLQTERGRDSSPNNGSTDVGPSPPFRMPAESSAERRRRRAILRGIAHLRANDRSNASSLLPSTSILPPPPLLSPPLESHRHQGTPSDRRLQGQRSQQNYQASLLGLQQAGARLAEASSSISALLNEPIRISSPDIAAQEYSGEAEVNRRRFKRRKLDSDASDVSFHTFHYGHFGQVVAGPLKMEIVSCDGGNYAEAAGERAYWANNVLRNDKSVYCTKSSRCNLVLRHQGESPFTLKKLVIKAPERGFTAPVQEGMVFVSMTADELFSRTAKYKIQYNPAPSRQSTRNERRNPAQARQALLGQIRGFDIPHPNNLFDSMSSSSRDYLGSWITRYGTNNDGDSGDNAGDSDASENDNEDDDETGDPSWAQHVATISPRHRDYPASSHVTMESTDNSADEEEETSPIHLADRSRRDLMSFGYSDDSNDEDEEGGSAGFLQEHHAFLGSTGRRSRKRSSPCQLLSLPWGGKRHDDGRENEPEIMMPLSRFFIRPQKNKISIRFDPPVSARYILIKLWGPFQDENIDIQSIIAYGFAGPRYFPAMEMR
ncbi:hypothetical protein L228DRAFT_271436 [Xylona heveae TC161]|uniref:Uncharacterized protein n=1 Tax=Xylona heveae (strain CBS 132557 / TC161) TaxID=1328760 RepID=A0A164ZJP0_XYLHT|nr:hypothetical protein L228DRAFT_271436 [Xylona heveae TC161]KZF19182.1 hypothetical protein L228DRAFT_271436 [Xylona heveae TC161]